MCVCVVLWGDNLGEREVGGLMPVEREELRVVSLPSGEGDQVPTCQPQDTGQGGLGAAFKRGILKE